jgi:hypothetical protein
MLARFSILCGPDSLPEQNCSQRCCLSTCRISNPSGISSHARVSAQGDLAAYPSDSRKQQEAVWAVAATDAFQWGYDPVHYGVPEGSYATDPDGPARIFEYRWVLCKQASNWWKLGSG